MSRTHPAPGVAAAAVALSLLAGCASFSPDGGFGPVDEAARRHLPPQTELRWARDDAAAAEIAATVATRLQQPLSMDDAVQVALLNNRQLQAAYESLGIAESDLVRAGRLPNPGFSFARLRRGSEVELERTLHLDLAGLLTMPLRRQLEARRFDAAQRAATLQVLALAADTRRAWVQAVAAEETLRYRRQVLAAANAGAELAQRMVTAGNFTKLQQLREQGFAAEAALGLLRAEQQRLAARERLTRLLGLWGEQTAFRLPERLPDLPAEPVDRPDLERVAMAERLDLQAARLDAEATARALGLSRVTRFVNVLELGLQSNGSNEAPTQHGWEIAVELPLFDFGTARVAQAEAIYRQALHRAAATAIDARSEVREAWGQYRLAWDAAKHQRDELVPLAQRVSEENVLRYNGMLLGVFELLADARTQVAAVIAAIDTHRDFWLAQADLDMALVGRPQLGAAAGSTMQSSAAPSADGAAH